LYVSNNFGGRTERLLIMSLKTFLIASLVPIVLVTSSVAAKPVENPEVQVSLSRQDDGWEADFLFSEASPVWLFRRTADSIDGGSWRSRSLAIETSGVYLSRIGNFDVLFRTDDKPIGSVRIRISPYSGPLNHDYLPVMSFSDGGLAFYSGHFAVLPETSLANVAVMPADLAAPELSGVLTINDPEHRLLVDGQVANGSAKLAIREDGKYAYTGPASPVQGPFFSQVIDPNLPSWARNDLEAFLPRLLETYSKRLGAPRGNRPMALVAWGGAEHDGYSQSGSVLPGMVVMTLSGKRMATPNPRVKAALRSFFGHEVAHFWLGQTVTYGNQDDSWITEGGSDYLAITVTKLIDAEYDQAASWQQQLDDCLARIGAGEPLVQAIARGDDKARYSCGSLLFLAATSAGRKQDAKVDGFTFVRQLIEDNRTSGQVTQAKWLTRFEGVGGSQLASDVRQFIETGSADPVTFWERLFTATGVAHRRDGVKLMIDETTKARVPSVTATLVD
jgi:hypothetical protein